MTKIKKRTKITIIGLAIVAAILSLCLLVGLNQKNTQAYANNGSGNLTINSTQQSKDYVVYQAWSLFTCDFSGDEDFPIDVQWSNSISGYESQVIQVLKNYDLSLPDDADAQTVALSISRTFSTNEPYFIKFSKELYNNVIKEITPTREFSANTTEFLPTGYYLIITKSSNETEEFTCTKPLWVPLTEAGKTITEKVSLPTVESKAKGQPIGDDMYDATEDWIGHKVFFKSDAQLPIDYSYYDKYELMFDFEIAEGLTFDKDSVKVYVDGTEITAGFEVITKEGVYSRVKFSDLKQISAVGNNSKITVGYDALLNNFARIGGDKFMCNEVKTKIDYSSNMLEPANTPEKETTKSVSVPDINRIFTFKLVLNVYGEDDQHKLSDAEYSRMSYDEDGTTIEIDPVPTYTEDKSVWTYNGIATKHVNENPDYTYTGVVHDTFTINETVTPAGYVKAKPIVFTTSSTYTQGDDPVLTDLSISFPTGAEYEASVDKDTGTFTINILHTKNSPLPTTGEVVKIALLVLCAGLIAAGSFGLYRSRRKKNSL